MGIDLVRCPLKKESQPSGAGRSGSSYVAFFVSHHRSLGYREQRCGFDTKHQSTKLFTQAFCMMQDKFQCPSVAGIYRHTSPKGPKS